MQSDSSRLAEGLNNIGLACEDQQQQQLLQFLTLLRKWNRVYNLTRITHPAAMVDLHLLDSLAVYPHLTGASILDVGTGAGLPGIPLAIMAPYLSFTLLDSNSKKTRFVQQAVIELGLKNVHVVLSRVEQFKIETNAYDTILTRAFASLSQIVDKTQHLRHPNSCILAQKGQILEQEINEITDMQVEIIPLIISSLASERHLIKILFNK